MVLSENEQLRLFVPEEGHQAIALLLRFSAPSRPAAAEQDDLNRRCKSSSNRSSMS